MMQEIFIPGELPDLNKTIKLTKKHWTAYSREKKEWTESIAWQVKKLRPIKGRAMFEFFWFCRDKRKDPDNIAFAKKHILDGLVVAEVLPDDNWKYVCTFIDHFEVKPNNVGVWLIIRSVT